METGQLEEARETVSRVIDTAQTDSKGTAQGSAEETASLPLDQQPGSNEALWRVLREGSHLDIPIPPRGRHKHRKPIVF
jgi:hypothetical protein